MKRLVQPGTKRVVGWRILVEGKALPGLISMEVSQNAHYQADTFRCQVALNAPGGQDGAWWGGDELKGQIFDLRASIDGDERSLILGEADRISLHPETGLIEIEGRDLTRRLIDARIQEAFQNKTSSEIVTILAGRRGLTPVVTATTTPAHRYYAADHDRVQLDQFSHVGTEWDLIVRLAKNENFDAFVTGRELHFQPITDITKVEPYGVRWSPEGRTGDVLNLHLDRSLTLAKDVVVIVRSWSSGQGRGFTRSSPAGAARAKVAAGTAQRYTYTRPNLTEDQAQKEADRLREDITKHERNISFDCPGELDLTPRDAIKLHTGWPSWDQTYFVNTITRRFSVQGGAAQSVTAKNHSPESDAP